MDGFIKWNCYDLAEQIDIFEQCKRELCELHEDLMRTSHMIESISVDKSDQIRKLSTNLTEIIRRLDVEKSTLDQSIDIYYAAETQARIQVETLPTTISRSTVIVSDSATTTGNAVMEDWLAALAFRQVI